LRDATAGGLSIAQIDDLKLVAIEPGCLLTSSFACGLGITFVLGAIFLAIELSEFSALIALGNGPDRSAFLSG